MSFTYPFLALLGVFFFRVSLAFSMHYGASLNDITQFQGEYETAHHVKGASLIVADFDLLRRDMPFLKNMTEAEIEYWLVENIPFVSEAQSKKNEVNTPIKLSGRVKTVLRPPEYRRGFIVPTVGSDGQNYNIDIKGSGSFEAPYLPL